MRKRRNKNSSAKNLNKKEKALSAFSGISGGLSFLGGWQVCHNLCLGIIALLSLIGITVAGMPLLFLTQYAIYFWSAAVLLLVPTLIMYWKNRKCMSGRLVMLNAGIVTASVPFLQNYQILFWAVGGFLIVASVFLFLRNRLARYSEAIK
ncbi:MAG: hypothetical protein QMD85_01220 [Candidatus Aenigmarchaeota archaeon]|nr:hypothetical protein [Candidatus Aenigmarchaeota archaeon]MDI6722164.1 hypothetical protein [Candidatus Aenigmarchaeota archaeon]